MFARRHLLVLELFHHIQDLNLDMSYLIRQRDRRVDKSVVLHKQARDADA